MPTIASSRAHLVPFFDKTLNTAIALGKTDTAAAELRIAHQFVKGNITLQVKQRTVDFDYIAHDLGDNKGQTALERISNDIFELLDPSQRSPAAKEAARNIALMLGDDEFVLSDEKAMREAYAHAHGIDESLDQWRPVERMINLSRGADGKSVVVHKYTRWNTRPEIGRGGEQPDARFDVASEVAVTFTLRGKNRSREFELSASVDVAQLTAANEADQQALTHYEASFIRKLLDRVACFFGAAGIRVDNTAKGPFSRIAMTRPIRQDLPAAGQPAGAVTHAPYHAGRHVYGRKVGAGPNGTMRLQSGENIANGRSDRTSSAPSQTDKAKRTETDLAQPGAIGKSSFNRLYEAKFHCGPEIQQEIPKYIHRFWSGRAMGEQTLDNLLAMANSVRDTPWKQVLWTSRMVNESVADQKLLQDQFSALRAAGVDICYIEDHPRLQRNSDTAAVSTNGSPIASVSGLADAIRERTVHAKAGILREDEIRAAAGLKTADPVRTPIEVKYLSDLARLAVTYEFGGVYMDTDIGPGTVDFRHAELHHRDARSEVPLAGPQVQNTQAFARILRNDEDRDKALFEHMNEIGTPVFNYFYATRPATESNLAALRFMIDNADTNGMQAAGLHFAAANRPRDWMIPWLDLGWTTSASDMDEGVEAPAPAEPLPPQHSIASQ